VEVIEPLNTINGPSVGRGVELSTITVVVVVSFGLLVLQARGFVLCPVSYLN